MRSGDRCLGDAPLGTPLGGLRRRLGEFDFGVARRSFGVADADDKRSACRFGGGNPRCQCIHLIGQPRKRFARVGRQFTFTGAVGVKPFALAAERRDAGLDRALCTLGIGERMAGVRCRVASGLRGGAQFAEPFSCIAAQRSGNALSLRRFGDALFGERRVGACSARRFCGIAPARKNQPPLGLFDRVGQRTVPLGRARLPPQYARTGNHFGDCLGHPRQIDFGRLQPDLGFTAAHVQPRDTGSFLEHRTAFGGLGGDDRADLALTDERGRMRAGCRIGEQQLRVARAGVAPIDPIGRSCSALDPPRDLDLVAVSLGQNRDFGKLTLWPRRGPGEDDVVHARSAQRFGRAFAHCPADRFKEVRLAAAVGADDAGQTGHDAQFDRVDERLEPRQFHARDLHRSGPTLSGARLGQSP